MQDLLQRFFIFSDQGVSLIPGSYNWGLVLLSLLVSIFSVTMAMVTVDFARDAERDKYRYLALGMGGLSLGCGIWTMHSIGMMAFELCSPVSYDTGCAPSSTRPSTASSPSTATV